MRLQFINKNFNENLKPSKVRYFTNFLDLWIQKTEFQFNCLKSSTQSDVDIENRTRKNHTQWNRKALHIQISLRIQKKKLNWHLQLLLEQRWLSDLYSLHILMWVLEQLHGMLIYNLVIMKLLLQRDLQWYSCIIIHRIFCLTFADYKHYCLMFFFS